MIPWIDENRAVFPSPDQALLEPDGLLCAGANLEPATLLKAYRSGIFPWYAGDDPILWWSPIARCVLFPQEIHQSRSLKRTMRKLNYEIKIDSCFETVMHACAEPRKTQKDTWITEDMIEAYTKLATLGHAHSIELFVDKQLVGGLYGINIGTAFFAESMFSRITSASRIILVWLCQYLEKTGINIIDCQVENPHLTSMGARIIDRRHYLALIKEACNQKPDDLLWHKNNA